MKAVRLALAFITLLALSTLAEAQTSKPAPGGDENPERILARAVRSHQSGDIEGAIRDYQAYLALRPERVEARSNLGAALQKGCSKPFSPGRGLRSRHIGCLRQSLYQVK